MMNVKHSVMHSPKLKRDRLTEQSHFTFRLLYAVKALLRSCVRTVMWLESGSMATLR